MIYKIQHEIGEKTIIYDDQDRAIKTLSEIHLLEDIVFIYANNYIQIENGRITVKFPTAIPLLQNKCVIPIVTMLPFGYSLDFKSLIPGITVQQVCYDVTLNGFEIDTIKPITNDDIIKLAEVKIPHYNIYQNIIIYFSVFNRAMVIKNRRIHGNMVDRNTESFEINVVKNVVTSEIHNIRNTYLIQSNYLYRNYLDI